MYTVHYIFNRPWRWICVVFEFFVKMLSITEKNMNKLNKNNCKAEKV